MTAAAEQVHTLLAAWVLTTQCCRGGDECEDGHRPTADSNQLLKQEGEASDQGTAAAASHNSTARTTVGGVAASGVPRDTGADFGGYSTPESSRTNRAEESSTEPFMMPQHEITATDYVSAKRREQEDQPDTGADFGAGNPYA